ncbi:Major facilitator superfamily MFS_1 (plasmid) [Rhodospirillum rubrum ATCC 11170]|uniref:Major facilitator superfamily MFS_1 n=1 Tax=Rhodospirillum rubrum (strain ATCC 11170 / ATH 1.1.1 / DSM 467 / LMG 4362 / NCIMB 8255 / S1) TaxID=269796 RepID=Q2RMM9_RHORT|nr:MFS transporter [Rhodospirillum rubrum]ABC24616.1 Major facilitator superfamily MFS_1 [Rhodospirillum rubrum ATCC 11170]QXG82501.1 MFS transporter [Rhodospirillum rubrum]
MSGVSTPRIPAADAPFASPDTPARRQAILAVMVGCAALVFGLGASLNLAVGRIATSPLHPSATAVLWIVDTYLVVFGCLLIPAGAIGDRYGRKQAMLAGLTFLAVGSLLSAVAATVPVLLAGRAVAGAGAALILPNSLALVVQVYPADQKSHAIAVWTGMTGLGGALGNILGGLVLQFAEWQAIFTVAVPLALAGLALTAWLAPRQAGHEHPLDLVGAGILMLSIFALLTGLIEGQELGWASTEVIGALCAAAALLAVFLTTAARRKHPLVDPRIFRARGLCAGMLGITASFIAMYSLFYLNGQYLMSVKGYPPALAGICTLPLVVVLFWLSPRSVQLARRFGARPVVAVGLAMLIVGLGLLRLCGADTSYWFYAASIGVIGIGSALSNPVLSTAIIGALPPHQAGVGSGINSFTREIGGALGVALFGSLLGSSFPSRLPDTLAQAHGAVQRSVGAALAYAESLPGTAANQTVQVVRQAFSGAMAQSLLTVMLVLAVAAVLAVLWYPASAGSAEK